MSGDPGGVSDTPAITIYSKPGCHLCDEMKHVVLGVSKTVPMTIEEVDISTDPELDSRYGLEIPVLLVDGQKAAKYRIADGELRRILEARRQR